jgi:hypothetical protein
MSQDRKETPQSKIRWVFWGGVSKLYVFIPTINPQIPSSLLSLVLPHATHQLLCKTSKKEKGGTSK